MSGLRAYTTGENLNSSMVMGLKDFTLFNDIDIPSYPTAGGMLLRVIHELYKTQGQVVVLIDDYDKPILDNMTDLGSANDMREILRSFYTTLKSCDQYLRFVMLTGISRFSKMGVFSAMNNLNDISQMNVTVNTQQELEDCFDDRITDVAERLKCVR